MNLHDAFMNASVAKRTMDNTPLGSRAGAESSHIHDRFRMERIWVMLLAVLLAAWQSQRFRAVRDWLATLTDTSKLGMMIKAENARPRHQRMVEVRNYMAHRDMRSFWDAGRMGAIGQLESNTALHKEFSRVLLIGLRALPSLTPWLDDQPAIEGEREGTEGL